MPAGKYALFTIPGKEEWVVIINTNHTQHLADEYDTDDDVVRLRVIPETMETPAESLTFDIAETAPHTGTVTLRWEKVKITFPFEAIQKLAQ